MLKPRKAADRALGAQRRAALHGDGRDGGGGAARSRGRARHPHGGRPAGRAGARDRDRGGARGAGDGRIGYTEIARHRRRCARASPRHYARRYGSTSIPARVVVTTGSSAGFMLAFLALFEPGDRVAHRRSRLSALPPHPDGARLRAGADRDRRGDALGARRPRRCCAAHRRTPLDGVLIASPANPTGTMMPARRSAALIARGRGRRHPVHLRRDLSRPRLCVPGGDRGALSDDARRHQLVLEIFLHDRLARRLDGGAGAAGAADRAAAAESRDLGADAVADRGGGRLRRRATRWRRSSTATRTTAASWSRACRAPGSSIPAGRRRVLSLCGCLALHQRQPSTSPGACSTRRTSRPRRASTSIRWTASKFMRFCYAGSRDDVRAAVERVGRWLNAVDAGCYRGTPRPWLRWQPGAIGGLGCSAAP